MQFLELRTEGKVTIIISKQVKIAQHLNKFQIVCDHEKYEGLEWEVCGGSFIVIHCIIIV